MRRWRDVRLAEARQRRYDRRLANVEEALKRCKERQEWAHD